MSVRLGGTASPGGGEPLDPSGLQRQAETILRALGQEEAELSVSLVGDDEMAELNLRYRGRPGPTDVLSFSLLEGEHADQRGSLLGDVVIGVDVAARQAAEAGHDLAEELGRLLIHGVLHLLGYDHEEPEPARLMRAEEERLRRALGP